MLNVIQGDMLRAAAAFGKTEADMVYGDGCPDAQIMLIGEAPGAEETRQRKPFVGKAGQNLDAFLRVIAQDRSDIYITNVVKFRPYKVSAKGTLSNRPPTTDEIACMRPHLMREIEAVAPDIVVTLGNVPLKCVLNDKKITIGACHAVPTPASALSHTFTLFPLYHPASIIYNRSLADVYQQDLLALASLIARA
jgi:DNA polymerase